MARFHTEAKAQARLSHANIATLHAFEQFGHTWVIVMEYLDGETFEQMIERRGPIPWEEAVPLFKQSLLGIGYAHRAGIVHRDIKPSNIMVARGGIVKVMDFGIAKVMGNQRMTRTGTRMGTLAYMSPEQIQNQPADVRSDIYSLGVTLYQLLSGHVPFESESEFKVMSDHITTPPPSPTRFYPYIPDGIVNSDLKSLSKNPQERFQSCEEFGAALEKTRRDWRDTATAILPGTGRLRCATILRAITGLPPPQFPPRHSIRLRLKIFRNLHRRSRTTRASCRPSRRQLRRPHSRRLLPRGPRGSLRLSAVRSLSSSLELF